MHEIFNFGGVAGVGYTGKSLFGQMGAVRLRLWQGLLFSRKMVPNAP